MAWSFLRLLRPFSRSRASLHVAISPYIRSLDVPHVPQRKPVALPHHSSWQQFARRHCLPNRPLPAVSEKAGEAELRDREGHISKPKRDVIKLQDDVAKVSVAVSKSDALDVTVSNDVAVTASDVAEITSILMSLGCTEPQLQRLLKKKSVALVKNRQHILRKAAIFRRFGIDSQQFLKTLEKDFRPNQHFLSASDDQHESVLHYLQDTLKVNNLGKLVSSWPPVLNYYPTTLESKLRIWVSRGVPITSCTLEKYPTLLSPSDKTVKEGIEGVQAMFPGPFGNTILSKFPFLACMSSQSLQQRADGFHQLFGNDVAKRLLEKQPGNLMTPISTMQHTYKQLQHHFGQERCLRMVQSQPSLIGFSWETLNPKLEFLVKVMGRSIEDVATNRSVLGYSLLNRLKPRYDALMKAKIKSGDYSLQAIVFSTNKTFEDRFGVSLPRRRV